MRNPSLHLFYYGVTHVIIVACLIPCLAAYKYTALIPCVAAYILHLSFWHYLPYILRKCFYSLVIVCDNEQ